MGEHADMSRHPDHLVLATDYRPPDPARVWPLLTQNSEALAGLGAHHVLVYSSIEDPGRILVTVGLRSRDPVRKVLGSRLFFDWFDALGVEDIPAVFAGETLDKITIVDADPDQPPGVIVAAITSVRDSRGLVGGLHRELDQIAAAGVRAIRIFRAFDDEHEVMMLQEIDNEADAAAWLANSEIAAAWMNGTGIGAYPPVFVGRFRHMIRIDESR